MSSKKITYIKKTVSFQGKQLIMYSIDGATWSSRKDELIAIIERHEQERQNFGGQIKGGPQAKVRSTAIKDSKATAEQAETEQVKSIKAKGKTPAKKVKTSGKEQAKSSSKAKATKARSSKPKVPAKPKLAAKARSKTKLPTPKKRASSSSKVRKSTKSKRSAA